MQLFISAWDNWYLNWLQLLIILKLKLTGFILIRFLHRLPSGYIIIRTWCVCVRSAHGGWSNNGGCAATQRVPVCAGYRKLTVPSLLFVKTLWHQDTGLQTQGWKVKSFNVRFGIFSPVHQKHHTPSEQMWAAGLLFSWGQEKTMTVLTCALCITHLWATVEHHNSVNWDSPFFIGKSALASCSFRPRLMVFISSLGLAHLAQTIVMRPTSKHGTPASHARGQSAWAWRDLFGNALY